MTCIVISAPKAEAASVSSILINMVPPYPNPYENVKISLNSYANNLDSILIAWSVNGKAVISGIGKKSFSTDAPAPGGETSVIATVYLPDGALEIKIPIRPSAMVLLWEANDSYVPPFYKGKALPMPASEVKVVAIPEIRTSSGLTDIKNMTYSWQKDYTNSVDGSGYGKNFFLYINDYLEDSNMISVIASTLDQSYSSKATLEIGTAQPKIAFYRRDSALGTLWDKALPNTYKIQGPEIFQAVPYFIAPKEIRNPMLVWNWFINDNRVAITSIEKNLMPLQASEGTSGTSKLRLEITNQEKIFANVSKEMNIEF